MFLETKWREIKFTVLQGASHRVINVIQQNKTKANFENRTETTSGHLWSRATAVNNSRHHSGHELANEWAHCSGKNTSYVTNCACCSRFVHARYDCQMIDRFHCWGDHRALTIRPKISKVSKRGQLAFCNKRSHGTKSVKQAHYYPALEH